VADIPFFLVTIDPNSRATVRLLKDWEACQSDDHKVSFSNSCYNSNSYLQFF
jgi:ubiquitin-like modifier-activating enzyme ATG7